MKVVLCNTEDIDVGEKKIIQIEGSNVVIFNINGDYYCISDVCSHDGGSISDGETDGYTIKCPRHGAKFDVRDGKAKSLPATRGIPCYSIEIVGGELIIDI
ncbi:MAG TPA: hypothetical protein DCL76_02260 [Chloroflexi bacterium]|nr:hypothetical protein [Chloroflexota bacterium]HCU98101.1 hypothetical protein [Chloroflexota bacterium]|tara:strand:- start:186 stop:488 length:303 start_codon:yes stop_codon:yes gene_type:complete